MVNTAVAMRPNRVKFGKISAKPETSTNDSDIGGGVSLLNSSPIITLSSTHKDDNESAHRAVSKEADTKGAPITLKDDEQADNIEPSTRLNPASTPFMPAPATTDGQSNDVAQPAPQVMPQPSQAHQQPFVLPASVVNMLPADDQNDGGQAYQTAAYPNGNVNGIPNGLNHNGMTPNYAQVQPSQQMVNGQGYSLNCVSPINGHYAVQPMQQPQMNIQQFSGAQGNQQQDLYTQIQAQKHALQQMNGGAVYQQAAVSLVPQMNSFPQAPVQNGFITHYNGNHNNGNAQYAGMGAPMGPLNPSASQNNIVSPPTSEATIASQETFATEPRNFAPRSAEPVTNGPPPQFSLPVTPMPAQYQAQAQTQQMMPYQVQPQNVSADPFTVAPIPAGIQPLQTIHSQPSNSLAVYSNPVPDHIKSLRSAQLNNITSGPTGRPSLEVALDPKNFPFVDSPRLAAAVNHGVVKLKNIPFATKRAEILAFLGRNSKVLNDNQEPVHIIMERVTSKTNDAYVEFMSMQAAITAVEKHQKIVSGGRLSRLGDRPIDVELSSQAALMEDLFPLARGIKWHGSSPEILPDHPTEPWQRFKGFISDEEMTMLVKHVEVPQRSPFSRDCPQRPFECMISTIKKLPWFMTAFITVRQRYSVFKAAQDLIRLLLQAIKDKRHEEHFNQQLLRRLYTAAMLCPGFSVVQKDDIALMLNLFDQQQREFNQPRFANNWTHIYTMAPKPGIPLDVLEWYIAVIREETVRSVNNYPLNIRSQVQQLGSNTNDYWGYFWHELNLPTGRDFDLMTLANLSTLEFQAIDRILRRAFSQ